MAIIANSDNEHDKEVMLLKQRLKRTQALCRAVYAYSDEIAQIKEFIASDMLTEASGWWNDLDYKVQKLLITAPLYGGPFTTSERAVIKSLWKISTTDIEECLQGDT
jgi:hypothetical protein